MGSAVLLDDFQNPAAELFYTATTGGSTGSGSWQSLQGDSGDVLIVVDVHAVTGSGTITVQAQTASANTGAGAANATDPRGTSLAITAVGVYLLPIASNAQANLFIGVQVSYTGFTGSIMTVVLLERLVAWNSGTTDS